MRATVRCQLESELAPIRIRRSGREDGRAAAAPGQPSCLKIGSRYVNYARSPFGYGLAVVGNYLDARERIARKVHAEAKTSMR